MKIRPLSFREVVAFVRDQHRHNKPPRGGKVFLGLFSLTRRLHGVAVLGRPSARAYDGAAKARDEYIAEVTRTCTDGAANANSQLYGACRQVARAMGYDRVITYTRKDESGASLKAAGFVRVKELPPRKNWANSSTKLKALRDAGEEEQVARVLWEVRFGSHEAK